MTYEEAIKEAKAGKTVRHPAMGKGWTMIWGEKLKSHFFVNPTTGSQHAFQLTADDRMRKDWEIVA